MFFLLGLLIGLIVMWFIAGLIVYFQARPLNQWFRDDRQTTALDILTWPSATKRVFRAGIEEGRDLKPHPAVPPGTPPKAA